MSTSRNNVFFSSTFSGAASIIKSASETASLRSRVGWILARVSFICASVICPLLRNFCRLERIMFMPLSMNLCSISRMRTLYLPVWAATCVIPCPMRPAPKTAIFLTSMILSPF